MQVWTIQIARWRYAEEKGVEFVDTTVKTGTSIFAPTWDMVKDHKLGNITDAEYTELYYTLMRERYMTDKQPWLDFIKRDKVAVACFCRSGVFCHRHLLVDILEKFAKTQRIPFERMGEIEKPHDQDSLAPDTGASARDL